MRDYTGPLNKRGYPKGPFMGLRGKAKQRPVGTGGMNESAARTMSRVQRDPVQG